MKGRLAPSPSLLQGPLVDKLLGTLCASIARLREGGQRGGSASENYGAYQGEASPGPVLTRRIRPLDPNQSLVNAIGRPMGGVIGPLRGLDIVHPIGAPSFPRRRAREKKGKASSTVRDAVRLPNILLAPREILPFFERSTPLRRVSWMCATRSSRSLVRGVEDGFELFRWNSKRLQFFQFLSTPGILLNRRFFTEIN